MLPLKHAIETVVFIYLSFCFPVTYTRITLSLVLILTPLQNLLHGAPVSYVLFALNGMSNQNWGLYIFLSAMCKHTYFPISSLKWDIVTF